MSVVPPSASQRSRRGRWLPFALFALASPAIVYLIAHAAATGLSPAAAAAMPPADYSRIVRSLLPAFADPRVPVPPQVMEMARRTAASSPMGYERFIVFARKAADEGKLDRAIALMEEARRRRHNFIPTRLLLMAYYTQAERYREAFAEMEYALRRSEEVRRLVIPELVKAMRKPDGRRALADLLVRDPLWREEFARVAQNEPLRPEEARELMELVRARLPKDRLEPERGLYMQALVRTGQARQARAVWLASLPEAERARHQLLYDGAFTGRPAPQPFGWRLHDMEAGRAEIVRGGGGSFLEINYFGSTSAVLAEQMLALAPGAYRLSFRARSEGGVTSGELQWTVACAPEGPEIARIRIVNPQPAYRPYQGDLAVPPSGCA